MAKLRGGTAELRIEAGRWRGLERQERVCKCCESGEVEDVEHLVMRCAHVKEERRKLMELMNERVEGWLSMEENERVAVAMDKACTDPAVRRAMERYGGRGLHSYWFPSLNQILNDMTLAMWTDY